MRKLLALAAALSLMASACSSTESSLSDNAELEMSDSPGSSVKVQALKSTEVVKSQAVEWFKCEPKSSRESIVILNVENQPFTEQNVCQHPVSQGIMQTGKTVVAINRPGAGGSQGTEVLGDTGSVETLAGAIQELQSSTQPIKGLWAFEEASILGFRLSKLLKLDILMIGNGIYDWELTLQDSLDPVFLSALKARVDAKDATFAEQRSVAWDFAGLPRHIYLYHTKPNLKISETQATSFRSALAASEYEVKLLILSEENAKLTPEIQKSVIVQILSGMTIAAKASTP